MVLIHHIIKSEKESTKQLRALYILELLTNYAENMESISFGLFHCDSFASICELIWLAVNPQDRTQINPSGFTGQGIKLLLYLLQSSYFTNIALNPLYFDFFEILLQDFENMHQSIQPLIIQHKQELGNYQYNKKEKDDEEELSPILPTFMETLSNDLKCIVGMLQPVVKLREQGFKQTIKVFATLLGFESAKTGGDYDFDLEFFHLRFPAKHTIDIANKSTLYSLNSILSIFIDTASCPAIIELLCQQSFINMVPIILRTFIKFFRKSDIDPTTWYDPNDITTYQHRDIDKQWIDRSELILKLLANTLKLTYIYLNELYVNNSFRYPYKIVCLLFEVQRVLASRVWQHDMNDFRRNNHYFTHIVDPLQMSSQTFVDCLLEFKQEQISSSFPPNPLLQTIYQSLAGIFAFTLCPPPPPNAFTMNQNISIEPDGIDDTLLYPEKFEIEEFLEQLAFEPGLFMTNLTTLHQTLIHVNALGLTQHWIKRLSQPSAQRKLLISMKHLALSSDFYIHQILPCVYIQLSQLHINIAQSILNPFIEMVFAQFLPVKYCIHSC